METLSTSDKVVAVVYKKGANYCSDLYNDSRSQLL